MFDYSRFPKRVANPAKWAAPVLPANVMLGRRSLLLVYTLAYFEQTYTICTAMAAVGRRGGQIESKIKRSIVGQSLQFITQFHPLI